ncbi:hypothetical protein [Zavarzinella formosa]|uniref:hypothetical protein n=1 Tax=Zavarzinella formosa TaxID=360055 RepID=UPI0012FABEAD|nr:hypothetical protein [Zavarzinella formosa]
MFRSPSTCPVEDETRKWIDQRWQWLEEQFGREMVRRATVVLPRPEFFPDPYDGTQASVRIMLDRVCGHMGVDPAIIRMFLYNNSDRDVKDPPFSGQLAGSVGTYAPENGIHRIGIEISNLGNPLGLVATIAHELGHVLLLGSGRITEEEADHEPLTDLLTVYFGMGVITSNAVVLETNWRAGNISGWSMSRQGYLAMPDFGYALAKYARLRDEDGPAWSGELRPDVRSPFKQAIRFLSLEESRS